MNQNYKQVRMKALKVKENKIARFETLVTLAVKVLKDRQKKDTMRPYYLTKVYQNGGCATVTIHKKKNNQNL